MLGAGGARGLAHIGVIRALEARGYRIDAIAGSSMGALVGGVYGMGELETYADWVSALQQTDVLRLLDWNLSGGGLIRGDRIVRKLRELIGERDIEDLDIDYTAVAVDIDRSREIWLRSGSLFSAIRASIAIPGVFTPHVYQGRTLLDGGIINPVPVAPTLTTLTELTIVVDANAAPVEPPPLEAAGESAREPGRLGMVRDFIGQLGSDRTGAGTGTATGTAAGIDTLPGMSAVLNRSLETMQAALTRQHLAVFHPDVVISVPKNACMVHEFHRAAPMIELGYRLTEETLASAHPGQHD